MLIAINLRAKPIADKHFPALKGVVAIVDSVFTFRISVSYFYILTIHFMLTQPDHGSFSTRCHRNMKR